MAPRETGNGCTGICIVVQLAIQNVGKMPPQALDSRVLMAGHFAVRKGSTVPPKCLSVFKLWSPGSCHRSNHVGVWRVAPEASRHSRSAKVCTQSGHAEACCLDELRRVRGGQLCCGSDAAPASKQCDRYGPQIPIKAEDFPPTGLAVGVQK